MTRSLTVSVSDELHGWIYEEAKELDIAISAFVESMIRAAFKKIGAGEAVRLGVESMAFTPRRALRVAYPWKVVKAVPHRGRMMADELRFGSFRLQHIGARAGGRSGPTHASDDKREPHGRDDQNLDGWYLTGPGLPSPFIWLGTRIAEAKRESVDWISRQRPARKRKGTG